MTKWGCNPKLLDVTLIPLHKKIYEVKIIKYLLSNPMLSKQFVTLNRALFTYGFASQKIKVKNPVAELDGD